MILTAAGVDDQFQKLWHCFGQLNLSHCFIIIVIVVIVVVIDFIIFIVDFIIFVITRSRTRLAFGQLGLPEMCHSWDGHHTTLNGLLGVQM